MESETVDKENQPVIKEVNYTKKDLIKAENPKLYSTIGKTVESIKPTAPIYSFGKAERKDLEKVFCSKALVKTQFMCKASPGPVYHPTYDQTVKTGPQFSFGIQERAKSVKEPYEHYKHDDVNFDIVTSELKVKKSLPPVKFKTGPRVC